MKTEESRLTEFANREALAEWLAGHVASRLADAIARHGHASLAVSGGSTPGRFFERLSEADIGWNDVAITLVDERWVPGHDPRSNHRLVREHLLRNKAAAARFVPLYRADSRPENLAIQTAEIVPLMPFDVILLGMGTDGHTASLFPGGDRLAEAVNSNAPPLIGMEARGAGETRVTLTLPAITRANELILHIEGEEKRRVLETAFQPGDPSEMPIRHVLALRPDIRIVWVP